MMQKESRSSKFANVSRWLNISLIGIMAAISLAGCLSSKARVIDEKYITLPPSYTDDVSRALAKGTFQKLPALYEDYQVGAEDVLEISIFEWELREETKSVEIRISETGQISLPVVGEMNVKGLTVDEVKAKIEKRLKDWQIIPDPRVSVVVQQFRSKRVAVVGAVGDPGTYTLRRNVTTLLDILSLAGGPANTAGQVVYVIRNIRPEPSARPLISAAQAQHPDEVDRTKNNSEEPVAPGLSPAETAEKQVIAIDLYELLELGDLDLNILVGDGDVVNIPEAKRFHVIGFAKDPGSFAMKKPTTVLEGIAMARGLMEEEASKRKCVLKRKTAQGEIFIPINVAAIARGKAPNLYIEPDDIIIVRQTLLRRVFIYTYNFVRGIFSIGMNVNDIKDF